MPGVAEKTERVLYEGEPEVEHETHIMNQFNDVSNALADKYKGEPEELTELNQLMEKQFGHQEWRRAGEDTYTKLNGFGARINELFFGYQDKADAETMLAFLETLAPPGSTDHITQGGDDGEVEGEEEEGEGRETELKDLSLEDEDDYEGDVIEADEAAAAAEEVEGAFEGDDDKDEL